MVELTSYGLTGLTAMLVIAICFAYADELPPTRENSSHDLINDAYLNDSRIIGTATGSLGLGSRVRERQTTASASLLRNASPAEAVRGAICSHGSQNDRGPKKAFNG